MLVDYVSEKTNKLRDIYRVIILYRYIDYGNEIEKLQNCLVYDIL